MNFRIHCGYLLLSIAVVVGCHSTDAPSPAPAAVTHSPTAPAVPTAGAAKADGSTARTPDLADPKVTSARVAEFKPPFPERTDLFEAPKRAQNAVRRDDEHGQSVELKGFVNVDQPRVVLSIDGVISPIPEGGEKYGVQVLSIQPPNVVWKRGAKSRTATFE